MFNAKYKTNKQKIKLDSASFLMSLVDLNKKKKITADIMTSLVAWMGGKASTYNAGDLGSIPGLGRSPGIGHDNPLQ